MVDDELNCISTCNMYTMKSLIKYIEGKFWMDLPIFSLDPTTYFPPKIRLSPLYTDFKHCFVGSVVDNQTIFVAFSGWLPNTS
jgi:hypothetical protein